MAFVLRFWSSGAAGERCSSYRKSRPQVRPACRVCRKIDTVSPMADSRIEGRYARFRRDGRQGVVTIPFMTHERPCVASNYGTAIGLESERYTLNQDERAG